MKTPCNELIEPLKKLKPNKVIYTSGRGNDYLFSEYRNERLFFHIPNRSHKNAPYTKSLTAEQFCELLKKLLKEKVLVTNDFPFKDCRISAFYGFINILYPKTFIKTHGRISYNSKTK